MNLRSLFVSLALFVLLVAACDPLLGAQSGERCDPGSYRPRCTDGVLFECVSGSDCIHHDCSGLGCQCFDYPNIHRTDCADRGQRCVVDKTRAFCE